MTTFAEFGHGTTATEVGAAFAEQIQGKHVLLVGVSPASLGEYMAVAIATHKPSLFILASRSKEKMDIVIKEINTRISDINIKTVEVDLASQQSIRKATEEIKSLTPNLDIIINNAGVNVPEKEFTKEGIELHFGTNHIGLFLLTNLLIPQLEAAAKDSEKGTTRIVNLTSAGHRLSPIRFSDYNFSKILEELPVEERPPPGLPSAFSEPGVAYSSFVAYGQSKTANILFSQSLTEKLKDRGIVSYSVHPGSIWTGLSRNLDEKGMKIIKSTAANWKNGDQGAATTLVAAFDPGLNDPKASETYMADCQLAEAAAHATDAVDAERLWKLSEELVKQEFSP